MPPRRLLALRPQAGGLIRTTCSAGDAEFTSSYNIYTWWVLRTRYKVFVQDLKVSVSYKHLIIVIDS